MRLAREIYKTIKTELKNRTKQEYLDHHKRCKFSSLQDRVNKLGASEIKIYEAARFENGWFRFICITLAKLLNESVRIVFILS